MSAPPYLVIGAGVGGLAAAVELASRGLPVVVLDRASGPGGKMRTATVGGRAIDAGPTVLTMRWIFEGIFERAGASLAERVDLVPLDVLARHSWGKEAGLDLFADTERSMAAVADFAGAKEADGYRRFCARSAEIFATLRGPFMEQACANPLTLTRRVGLRGLSSLTKSSPFRSMHDALTDYFRDPRLLQLFGRYATYCGSSPYLAPATLFVVPHVEQCGVWSVSGGMVALATALEQLAREKGVIFRYDCEVKEMRVTAGVVTAVVTATGEHLATSGVVANADEQALAHGLFGAAVARVVKPIAVEQRSLSAVTWAFNGTARGFTLARHNVFFSPDYAHEFAQILRHRQVPDQPTVYVCAQDRADSAPTTPGTERLFCLINAPACGDVAPLSKTELNECLNRALHQLLASGLELTFDRQQMEVADPRAFHRRFPATGGAFYGRASHGWNASFQRPGARTKLRNLYLAGGSVHPGPGVPMAAQSGVIAASAILEDLHSTGRYRTTATRGGTSTR